MENPIRVLHILQRMEAGGTQALLMNIYRKIDRNKVQFDFLVEYPEKQFYDDEIKQLGGRIYYSTVRKDFNILRFTNYLKKILGENSKYKIVHVHTYSIGYFCLKTAKKMGVPIRIAHSHSNSMTNDAKKYVKILMQKLYIIHATDLFACSEDAGKYLFRKKSFNVLTNAIDSSKFIADSVVRQEVRRELGVSDFFVVGHTGRFKPEKNHKFLIDVFDKIKTQRLNSKLLLVGNGDPSDEVKKYIQEKGLKDDVIILTNRKDMNRLYQAMDLFVFPSKYEGLGIVAIEAQAAGVPVLCSNRIPIDTKVTPLYDRLPLESAVQEWASQGIALADNKMAHTNTQDYIISSGYDISATVKMMEEFYLQRIEG